MASTHVIVRGFDFGTPEDVLVDAFSEHGEIEKIKFRNKGEALITYADPEAAQAAVTHLDNAVLAGNTRYINVNFRERLPAAAGTGTPWRSSEKPSALAALPSASVAAAVASRKRAAPTPLPSTSGASATSGKRRLTEHPGSDADPDLALSVLVRGFDFGTKQESVYDHCVQVGTILSVTMQKGSAVVTYSTRTAAHLAVQQLHTTTIEGNSRYIEVIPVRGHEDIDNEPVVADSAREQHRQARAVDTWDVLVRGFDFDTPEDAVLDHCSQVGQVLSVSMRKGSALVTYGTEKEAQEAVDSLNKSTIEGNSRYIDVSLPGRARDQDRTAGAKGSEPMPSHEDIGNKPVVVDSARVQRRQVPKKGTGDSKRGSVMSVADAWEVLVRGFDFDTPEDAVFDHCSQVGQVLSVSMRKGSAIVTYGTEEDAQAAVDSLHKSTIEGNSRYIDVSVQGRAQAQDRAADARGPEPPAGQPRIKSTRPTKREQASHIDDHEASPCDVYVRGFDFETPEEDVYNHCSQCGEVLALVMKKGSAMVTYGGLEMAQAAIDALDGSTIEGNSRYIEVRLKSKGQVLDSVAEPTPAKEQRVGSSGNEAVWASSLAHAWKLFCSATPVPGRTLDAFLLGHPPAGHVLLKYR